MSFDFLAAIKNIAPTLVGTFLGPLAGMGVKTLVDFIPDEHKATVNAALTSGGTDGAIAKLGELFQQGAINAVQIKQAEAAHAEKMAELGFKNTADLERIAADDRASARDLAKTTGTAKMLLVLSIVILCLTVGAELVVLFGGYKPSLSEIIVGRVLGLLDAATMMVLNYWYGTTHGSSTKDETIAAIAKS